MNAGKTILTLVAGTLLVTAPAFADHPRWAPARGHRHDAERVVVVKHRYDHRPAVRQTVVVREPVVVRRTVIVERPVYAGAAPNQVLSTLGGAIIGAAIGSQFGKGNGRTAATAIGAVVGGVIGSN